MKYKVKKEFADTETYLPQLHMTVCPSLLTQGEISHLVRLGCGFMFEIVEPKSKIIEKVLPATDDSNNEIGAE